MIRSSLLLLLGFLTFGLLTSGLLMPSIGWASEVEPRLSHRVTQAEIENSMSLFQIRLEGQRIFSTPFNSADGIGDGPVDASDSTSPGGRPTFLNHGSLLRFNGLDSQACVECHSLLSTDTIPPEFAVGGVGGLSQNAFPGVVEPDIGDYDQNGHAKVQGRVINPPFVFGSGGVELLGKEMTQDLQDQKRQARDNPDTVVNLASKGISFGTISHNGSEFDFSNVEGVGEDLVIRPFGRTGCCATVREFDVGALQFHHGMQPVEVVGEDNDADGDGISNEILVGELSAMHIFEVSTERPTQVHRRWQTREERLGRRIFRQIGCADCHTPRMRTRSRNLTLSFPEVMDDPSANVYFSINLTRWAPGFRAAGAGVQVRLFADLKLHDMGPDLAEETGNALFTTARLWGVADTAPYLHDGRALTLRDAISQHGGEAETNAEAFLGLRESEQNALLAFLKTLRTPQRPHLGLEEQ